jgi:hypothetical protein
MAASSRTDPTEVLASRPMARSRLALQDYLSRGSTQSNTTGQKSQIAELTLDQAVVLRNDVAAKIALTAFEEFATDGTTNNQEQFDFSNNIIKSPVTSNFELFESGNAVDEDAIDYANDHFDYTDDGANNDLDAYYIVGPAGAEATIEKVSQDGNVKQEVFSAPLGILHNRDQAEAGFSFDFSTALAPVVPRDMTLRVSVNAGYTVKLHDDTDGTDAINARLDLPVRRVEGEPIPGLAERVRRDMAG